MKIAHGVRQYMESFPPGQKPQLRLAQIRNVIAQQVDMEMRGHYWDAKATVKQMLGDQYDEDAGSDALNIVYEDDPEFQLRNKRLQLPEKLKSKKQD